MENVAVISQGGGMLDRCLFIDGVNIPPSAPQGVGIRDVYLANFTASGGAVCTVEFRNVCSLKWFGGNVQGGTDESDAKMVISGADTQAIDIYGVGVWGMLHLMPNTKNLVFDGGRASYLTIDSGVTHSAIRTRVTNQVINNTKPADSVSVVKV